MEGSVDSKKMLEQEPEFKRFCEEVCFGIMQKSAGDDSGKALTDLMASFWIQGRSKDELVSLIITMFRFSSNK